MWLVHTTGRVFFAMRTLVLIDGQNLYHLAKTAWGPGGSYDWPSYDVDKLARALVRLQPFGGISVFGGTFMDVPVNSSLVSPVAGCEVDIDRQEKIILFVVDPS